METTAHQRLHTLDAQREKGIYTFEYDRRYHTTKSVMPTLAKVSLAGDRPHYERIALPRMGRGKIIVRLKGTYTGRDGDVFVSVENGYAEISLVYHTFQFPIWWGDEEKVSSQNSWLTEFLARSHAVSPQIVTALEHHLSFIREHACGRPGEESALLDLMASSRAGKGIDNG
jgi:hypothetical protein